MPFDPLILLFGPALLLAAAGGLAVGRLRGGWPPPQDAFASGEPSMAPGEFDDRLTGIGNRRAFEQSGAALLGAAQAQGHDASLLLLDLDRFDGINAAHGRDLGDCLLATFARVIHDYLPPTSLVCRLGADTFAAILPAAGRDRAAAVADEIRMLFAHLSVKGPAGPVRATVSIGIASACGGDTDLETLLHRADLCLDRAKADGRNRVDIEHGPDHGRTPQQRGAARRRGPTSFGVETSMPTK